MKICLIGDTHAGVRNDSTFFIEYQRDFFVNKFFPYLVENGIDTIIHLGDMFDRRKYINYTSLAHAKENFIKLAVKNNIFIHMLVGNHDTYYKSNGNLVSSKLLFDHYEESGHMRIYDTMEEVTLGGIDFLMVPWIFPDNADEWIERIKISNAEVCCGHFEMNGVVYQGSTVSQKGLPTSLFDSFGYTFSGHYHKPSYFYVGSPYQMSWADYEDDKRVIVLDCETGLTEDVLLSEPIYKVLEYDGPDTVLDNVEQYKGKILKLIVRSKDNPFHYEKFLKMIEDVEPHAINIKEHYLYMETINNEECDESLDTLTIFLNCVDEIPDLQKGDVMVIKDIIKKTYKRAKSQ